MKLSLRIIILMTAITTLTGVLSAVISTQTLHDEFRNDQYRWAKVLTATIADSLANTFIVNDKNQARNILLKFKSESKHINHAYITDAKGHVFAHTFDSEVPAQLLSHAYTQDFIPINLDMKTVYEISLPITNAENATIQIGIDEHSLETQTRNLLIRLITLYTLIILAVCLIAVWFGRRLTMPLENLSRKMHNYADSGNIKHLRSEPDLYEANELIKAFNRIIDSRETTKTQLSSAEIRLQLLLDSTGEAIYGVGIDGCCTFANPACAQILGYDAPSDLLNKNMHELIHHHHEDGSEYHVDDCQIYKAHICGISSHSDSEVFWHKNGHSLPVEYWSYPIIDNDETKGSVITFIDITQRKHNGKRLDFSLKLSQAMSYAMSSFMASPMDIHPIFEHMLNDLLELTGSKYGFIGEILANEEGERYLKTYSITDIAWNDETRELYARFGKVGLEFTNLNTLFGITIKNDEVVISNDPMNDARSGGLPEGHPALNSYMGIPLMAGDNNIGMIGIANREQGYDKNIIDDISPLLKTYANVMLGLRNNHERERINKELRESEASLATAQNISHVGSWVWDIQTGGLSWSDEIYRIFGLMPQEFPATYEAFLSHIHPEDTDAVVTAVNDAVGEEHKEYSIHHRIIRPSGEIRIVHEEGIVFTDENNQPARMVGAVHDITELVKYQEQLEELVEERTRDLHDAQEELVRKERLATLGQLTATVSHELRNPLAAMRPSLYIIEKKTGHIDDEILQSAVQRVDRSISRCDRIIDELLNYTRINELNCNETILDNWLNEVIHEQEINEDIKIEWQPGLDDRKVIIDLERFRRAVINVIENACHAMINDESKKTITPGSRLTIRSFRENNRINIQISDNGSGIPDDVLPQIFTPLFSTKGFGVGLGMPTVKQIMQQHSGGIDIETQPEQGTTITLWLPEDSQT